MKPTVTLVLVAALFVVALSFVSGEPNPDIKDASKDTNVTDVTIPKQPEQALNLTTIPSIVSNETVTLDKNGLNDTNKEFRGKDKVAKTNSANKLESALFIGLIPVSIILRKFF